MTATPPTAEDIRERLSTVEDPDLGEDIVSLDLINGIDIDHDEEVVYLDLTLGAPFSPGEKCSGASRWPPGWE